MRSDGDSGTRSDHPAIVGAVELAMADKTVTDRLDPAGFVPFHLKHGTIVDCTIEQSELRKKLRAGTNHSN
jgi:hypothetical protein